MERKYKIIEVHRHFNLVEMVQTEPEVQNWLAQSFRAIGPYYEPKTKATATGLTFEEQRILLPEHIGIEATDKDFRRKVIEFYDAKVTSIPRAGLKLNISLKDDNQPMSADNLPVSIGEYLTYYHIKGHRDVAKDKTEAERGFHKRFYLVDPDGVSAEVSYLNDLEDRAMTLYMKYKDDTIKTDQILTMLGKDVRPLKRQEKIILLKEAATGDNRLSEVEQREAFNNFIRVVEDKELEYKYLITEMIGAQYLRRVGNNIIYTESAKKIGDNMEDAVLYFKNAKNSRELNLLKAEYQAKVRKGVDYLPKEDPEVTKTT